MSRRPLPASAAVRLLIAAALVSLTACGGGGDAAGPSAPRTPPAPTTGTVTLEIAGLPTGATPAIRLTGPAGDRQITAAGPVTDLAPGEYTVAAAPVTATVGGFAPDSASRAISVRAGATTAVRVAYTITTGSVAITATGLPSGAAPRFALRSASGAERALGDTSTITHLAPGAYLLRVLTSRSDSGSWAPSIDSLPLTISATDEPIRVPVSYRALPVQLAIDVAGLPAGAEASMILRGPGMARPVVQSLRFDSLARGAYELEIGSVRASGFTWLPDSTRRAVTLRAGDSTRVAVRYGLTTGALAVTVAGVPSGVQATVRVNGPDNFTRLLSATTTLTDLVPGDYDVVPDTVLSAIGRFNPVSAAVRVRVTASMTPATAAVQYRAAPGRILISVTGVPAGQTATITATGSDGWTRSVSGSAELTDVPAGVVRLTASSITINGDLWRPTPPSIDITVPAGGTAIAPLTYAVATGRIQLTPTGLPLGAIATVAITGPNNYSSTIDVSAATTIGALDPGSYTLTPRSFTSLGTTYTPNAPSFTVTVVRGASAPVTIGWLTQNALTNLTIDAAYVTQATQRLDGSVPLVANRDGMLRVFVRASQANSWRPAVRVQLYDGTNLVQSSVLEAQEASVRTVVAEGSLTASWNLPVPAALMRTSLRVLAEVDPAGAFQESDETDNRWPRSGTPQAIDVRNVPALPLRFVPVVNAGRTGDVSTGNVEQFLTSTRRLFPLGTVNVSVRAPYTSTTPQLDANDANNAWETILTEINALRVLEGPPNTYYYGVVKVAYNSGIAGLGYVPGRASIGWDYLPSGDGVTAHELGHNFGRGHAPCGVAGDANYPYAGGLIGVFGFNLASNTVVPSSRSDLMGYCSNTWVSDWTWTNVLQHRQTAGSLVTSAAARSAGAAAGRRVLLVWGRATGQRIVVEPAFATEGTPSISPISRGGYRVDARDATGTLLFSYRFDAEAVDHARAGGTEHFAVTVPVDADAESRIASLTVSRAADGATARISTTSSAAASQTDVDAVRATTGRLRLRYDAQATRMAMVRDASTGEILSFVRSSDVSVHAPRGNIDVLLSDGVHTRTARVRAVQPN